jgi:hypothetical protein
MKTIEPVRHDNGRGSMDAVAQGLGLFSLALGAAELFAPRQLARWLDIEGQESLLQLYGLREIGVGIGLLASENRAPWLWARVAGDALDLATLGVAAGTSRRKGAVAIATASVALVTALDVACARALSQESYQDGEWVPDYSDRIGFPRHPEQMRGTASFETPPEYRASLKSSEEVPRTPVRRPAGSTGN